MLTEAQARYGPCLIRDRHPVLAQYLDWEYGVKEKILSGLMNAATSHSTKSAPGETLKKRPDEAPALRTAQRRRQVEEDMRLNREVRNRIQPVTR